MLWARNRPNRFVRESLRFAHRWVRRIPADIGVFCDVVRLFVVSGGKPLTPKSDAILEELMGSNITRPERFARGVVEHPQFGSCVGGTPGELAKGGFRAVFHT